MSFNEPHIATWVQVATGPYNTVVETSEEFSCMIEEEAQFKYELGQPVEVGKGIIFTSASLAFRDGDRVIVDETIFVIKRLIKLGDDGEFHHFEIIYG